MRDYIVLAIILGSLPFCLFRPYIGILMWSWVSYMSPHRLSWSFARSFPVAQYIGIVTLCGLFFTRDRKKLPLERETILLLLLWGTFVISSFFAIRPDLAWEQLEQVSKILLMTFVTLLLLQDRKKLKYLLLTIVFSVGFFGFKGGIWSLLSGGNNRVYGPTGGFFEDNNDLALALLLVLPLMLLLVREMHNKKLKVVLLATIFFSIISIIFTYSRGGFVGLGILALMFTLKAKRKFLATSILIFAFVLLFNFAPEKWLNRMETLKTDDRYEGEGSIQGRFNVWHCSWNLALVRPLTGGGFGCWVPEVFIMYAPNPDDVHDAHSIYFEMLGEHGFIALGLFLALLISSYLSLQKLKRQFRHITSLQWISNYCNMLQLCIIVYMTSGTFLGRAYFDLFYHIIAVIIIVKVLAKKEYELLVHSKEEDYAKNNFIAR